MCPSGTHLMGQAIQNFELKSQIDNILQSQVILKSQVYKKEFKIGMIPENTMNEFFNFYYFPQFKFFDLVKKVVRFSLAKDENSYIRQQSLTIELRKEYYYSQVLYQMRDKVLRQEDTCYKLISPLDDSVHASPEYRKFMSKDFDLLAIQMEYPLEPNYVIVEDLPNFVDVNLIINLNFERLGIPDNQVKGEIQRLYGQETSKLCHIVFDFAGNSLICGRFASGIQSQGLMIDKLNSSDSLLQIVPQRNLYYRFLFKAQRNGQNWSYHPNIFPERVPQREQIQQLPQWGMPNRGLQEQTTRSTQSEVSNQWGNQPDQQRVQQQSNQYQGDSNRQAQGYRNSNRGYDQQQRDTNMNDDQNNRDFQGGENFRKYGRGEQLERQNDNEGRGRGYGRGGQYGRGGGDRDNFRRERDDRDFRPRENYRGGGRGDREYKQRDDFREGDFRNSRPRDNYEPRGGRGQGRGRGRDFEQAYDRNEDNIQVIEEEIKENEIPQQNRGKPSGQKEDFTNMWDRGSNKSMSKEENPPNNQVKTEQINTQSSDQQNESPIKKSFGRGQDQQPEINSQGSSQGRGRGQGRGSDSGSQPDGDMKPKSFGRGSNNENTQSDRQPERSFGRGQRRDQDNQSDTQSQGEGRGKAQYGRGNDRDRDSYNQNSSEGRGGRGRGSFGRGQNDYGNQRDDRNYDRDRGRGNYARGGQSRGSARYDDQPNEGRGRGGSKKNFTSAWELNDSQEQQNRLKRPMNESGEEAKFEDVGAQQKSYGRGQGDNGQQRQFGRGQRN